jgi:hypothetical protein
MLTLTVPPTEESVQPPPVETRPKATREWLERLPFASPVDTAQQVVTALSALNRRPLGEEERHTLMALYRPVVARAAAGLETLLAETGVPPHGQPRHSGVLLRALLTEHSIGYKHVLLALDKRRVGRTLPKRAAEVAARLLAALRDLQTACYLAYSTPPAGLWLEMHQVYQVAQTTGKADAVVDGTLPASLVYRQALLLALADPPHMSHAEIVHTRMYLDKFAADAVLRPAIPSRARNGFVVATDGDRGPGQLPAVLKEGDLWLDTHALCRNLNETAIRLRIGESPRHMGLPQNMEFELSLRLSTQLLKRWRAGSQRAFKRYPPAPGETVQIVAGVNAIHRLLEPVPPTAGSGTEADGSLPINDVEPIAAAPAAVNATRWAISNDSATGLALIGAPDTPLNLKVGDALALRSDGAAGWALAVIRWVRMRDARQVELGVERLAPQVHPVWVRPLYGQRNTSPEAALFVPGLPALKQPDRLVLPRPLYQSGMDAEVLHPPHRYTLTFGHRLEHTPSFDLIDFTVFSDEPQDD